MRKTIYSQKYLLCSSDYHNVNNVYSFYRSLLNTCAMKKGPINFIFNLKKVILYVNKPI